MIETEVIRLVDDNDTQRDALQFMLECEGYAVRAYRSAKEFLKAESFSEPGCTILDLKMPEMNGLELQQELVQRGYSVPIIFLSAHGDLPKAVQAMKLGGRDFLEKPVNPPKLLEVISAVLAEQRNKRQGLDPKVVLSQFEELPERQKEIATLLSRGLLKRQVAERLGISLKTVDAQTQTLYRKLGIHSVAELSAVVRLCEQHR